MAKIVITEIPYPSTKNRTHREDAELIPYQEDPILGRCARRIGRRPIRLDHEPRSKNVVRVLMGMACMRSSDLEVAIPRT